MILISKKNQQQNPLVISLFFLFLLVIELVKMPTISARSVYTGCIDDDLSSSTGSYNRSSIGGDEHQIRSNMDDPARMTSKEKKSKEPRKFSQEEEEEGCKIIFSNLELTQSEKETNLVDGSSNVDIDALVLRHYRADKGDINKAIKRTQYAIQWRKDFGVDRILRSVHSGTSTPIVKDDHHCGVNEPNEDDNDDEDEELEKLGAIIKKEGETGKIYARGYDKEGRAILYFFPANENTYDGPNNIKHLVYQVERAIACTEKNGYEKIIIIMDFTGWTFQIAAPMDVTKQTIHILQHCYVERLKSVYMTNSPVLFRSFWAMVKPFIDPFTKEKITFCSGKKAIEAMRRSFDLSALEKIAYGTRELKPFDSKEYFAASLDTTFNENYE